MADSNLNVPVIIQATRLDTSILPQYLQPVLSAVCCRNQELMSVTG